MAVKMKNAPVFYTLAQIRFNPVALMGQFVPKIQDRLRRAGFPDFRAETHQTVQFMQSGEKPGVQTAQATRWNFLNSKTTEGYLLDQAALSFHTSSYDVFATFLEKLLTGLALVHEATQLAYTERIGLRYLDAVTPAKGETLENYLSPSVLGLHRGLQGKLVHCFSETLVESACGSLITRVIIRNGKLTYPVDLQPNALKEDDRLSSVNGLHAVLDNDHFEATRADFNMDQIRAKLGSMHDGIDEAFRATVTPFALKQWK